MNGELTKKEILVKLHLSDEKNLTAAYLNPAIDKGLVEITLPDKPTSKNQKYRLTAKGKALKKKMV